MSPPGRPSGWTAASSPTPSTSSADGGTLTSTQSVFAGTFHVRSQVVRGIPVITVMPNAVTAQAAPAQPRVERVDVEFTDGARGRRGHQPHRQDRAPAPTWRTRP